MRADVLHVTFIAPDHELVMKTSGKTTKGKTIERMTWDATKRVSRPCLPSDTDTMTDGCSERQVKAPRTGMNNSPQYRSVA